MSLRFSASRLSFEPPRAQRHRGFQTSPRQLSGGGVRLRLRLGSLELLDELAAEALHGLRGFARPPASRRCPRSRTRRFELLKHARVQLKQLRALLHRLLEHRARGTRRGGGAFARGVRVLRGATRRAGDKFQLSCGAPTCRRQLGGARLQAATAASASSALRCAWRSAPIARSSQIGASCFPPAPARPSPRPPCASSLGGGEDLGGTAATPEESSSLRRLSRAFSAFARATNSAAPRASRSLAALCASAADLASPATESRSESMNLALSSRRRAFAHSQGRAGR